MEDLIKFISQVGFPAAIAIFVLVRLENSLNSLKDSFQDAMEKNTKVLAVLCAKLDCEDEVLKNLANADNPGAEKKPVAA